MPPTESPLTTRRHTLRTPRAFPAFVTLLALLLAACSTVPLRGTGDLGVVIERTTGQAQIVDTTRDRVLAQISGLGDLSHATVVFSRDQRYAYVFARDGALTKIDLLRARIVARVMQAKNSIGGAISQDGRFIAAANYYPGGVNIFRADTLAPVAHMATRGPNGKPSRVVGLVSAPGDRFVFSLFDAGEIWLVDLAHAGGTAEPRIMKFRDVGREPYDGVLTPDGRYYLAGLFGEDGMALLDLWHPKAGVRRILEGYGKGRRRLPVYKMPHLEGWAFIGRYAFVPAVGHHEVLVVDTGRWRLAGRIPVAGQPVFVVGQPYSGRVWVNFAFPHNDRVQVIDGVRRRVIATLHPGKGIMYMEFTPRGTQVWMSARDSDRVVIYDTASLRRIASFRSTRPSGIFFTSRAYKLGW